MADEPKPAAAGEAVGGCLVLVVAFLLLRCCFWGGSSSNPPASQTPSPTAASTSSGAAPSGHSVDGEFLAGNPGLQAAHNNDSSGDGFRTIIEMKTTGCWQTVTASPIGHHRYQVICSAGSGSDGLRFNKFMVDTDTGFVMEAGSTQ